MAGRHMGKEGEEESLEAQQFIKGAPGNGVSTDGVPWSVVATRTIKLRHHLIGTQGNKCASKDHAFTDQVVREQLAGVERRQQW